MGYTLKTIVNMTRAEERALEAYPYKIEEHPKVMCGVITYDANKQPRVFFQEGYEQAEKDLGWHSVDESLPPMDEEVIVLLGRYDDLFEIAVGHIVNKDIAIDFNGWNIPGVKFWMPMPEIPKEEKK